MTQTSVILIVDDNELGREALGDVLEPEGYSLAFAANGPDALRQAEELQPDLILLDVMMPGMDGFEVCRRLRADARLAEAPVVMVTALDDKASRIRGIEAGADDFIAKPFDRVELRARVRTIVRLNRYRKLREELERREQAEAEREKLRAQFYQAQKMESIGRLAGGVAHDFNNLLSLILGYTEMGLMKVDERNPVRTDLQEIRKAAQRSADLTRQLLSFARPQPVTPKELDLNVTIEGMLKMLGRLIGAGIELDWHPAANLDAVLMAPSQMDQILANLCINARDAIGGRGKVTIETANVSFDANDAAGEMSFTPGDYAMLAVSDDGCGMDADTRARIFEPFFTTKEEGKGTGLGLATVYSIVRQNEGFINVYSEPGRGTTFKVYLPRHASECKAAPSAAVEAAFTTGSETILLVDDDTSLREMTREMLQCLGYTVVAAESPAQALQLAREHAGVIRLLLSDVNMPDMDGPELAREVAALCPGVRLLFASGYMHKAISGEGGLDNGFHFIQKPFSTKALAAKIREVLDEP